MTSTLALAALCDWAAALLAAPVPVERLAAWRAPEGAAALAALGEAAELGPEVAALYRSFALGAPEATAAAIAAAHVALFSGAAGPRTVAPYESVHRSEAGLLYQGPAAAMQALLDRFDLAAIGLPAEPPDHLAVELALLAALLRAGDAGGAAHLLQAHLLAWVPRFAGLCRRHDPHGLYAALAALLPPLLDRIRDLPALGIAASTLEETAS